MTNKNLMLKLAKQELAKKQSYILPDLLGSAFKEQLDFIKDSSKRKSACCTRRAGKSYGVGLYLIDECLKTKCNCLYVARTKESAENIMWNDIIDVVIKKYNIKVTPGISKLTLKFENGSILYLVGADANEKQMRALVGKKYNLIVIDECQYFKNDLEMLVLKVLMPSLGDTNGTVCLIGTVGNEISDSNFWYSVNHGKPGWSAHEWHWKDNLSIRDTVQMQVDDLLKDNPKIANTDWFQQEYEGKWLSNIDMRIYSSTKNNYIDHLPNGFHIGATYNLGMDLGFIDGTTFCVTAYNNDIDNRMYTIESKKYTGLIVTEIANTIKKYRSKYNFNNMVVDAGSQGKTIVEELKRIHGLPLVAAQKLGKEAHVASLNSDFITDNVLILKSGNEQLIKELDTLIKDKKAMEQGIWKESDSKKNDICDALLYSHHFSRHYWYTAKPKQLTNDEIVRNFIINKYCTQKEQFIKEDDYWSDLNDN